MCYWTLHFMTDKDSKPLESEEENILAQKILQHGLTF